MMTKNILIIGAGKLGLPLAHALHRRGYCIHLLSKNPKNTPKGITHLACDVHLLNEDSFFDKVFDWVYVILSPKERSLLGYQQTYANTVLPITQALQSQNVKRLIYISSTRVYGQNAGEWIDDDTYPKPAFDDGYGQILRAAELLWQAYWQEKLTIIRPSGLYDGTSTRWQQLATNFDAHANNQHFINLITYGDVVRFLAQLPSLAKIESSYLLSSQPLCQVHFFNHLRQKQGLTAVCLGDNPTTTGKKIASTHLKALGFVCTDILANKDNQDNF